MEAKYRQYRSFDWTESAKWQMFLTNLYPIPASEHLERIRKKWYRDNIDKDFDITYG
jgi:hypothetical protein